MKKITSIILAALLAASLAACGDTEVTTAKTTAETIPETTVETTAVVTTVEETTVETTAETTVVTTEETTAQTTAATTAATTVATTEATTAATTVATTEATTAKTTVPVETTTVPAETTTVPAETTTAPAETTAPDVTEEPAAFDFAAENLSEYVLLGQYLGIEVSVPAPDPVTDEEVEEQIDAIIETLPAEAMVYDVACVLGDKVNINFVGRIDGEKFEGGSANDVALVLGEGGYIPGFEDGIVGMTPTETKTVSVTFPEDYHNADYAGKAADFEITLNYIYPKLTDEMAKEFFGYDSADAIRAEVRAELESQAQSENESEKESAAWTKVLANSSMVYYPEELLNAEYEAQIASYEAMAQSYGMTYEELFVYGYGISVEEAENILFNTAKSAVKQQLVLYSIARDKGMPLDDASYEGDMLALANGFGLESIDEFLAQTGYTKADIKELLIYTTIITEVVENANFVEISE